MENLTEKLDEIMQRVQVLDTKSSPDKRLFREIVNTYDIFNLLKTDKSRQKRVCVADTV